MSAQQDALYEIVRKLEDAVTAVVAMESALIELGCVAATDIDNRTARARIDAKHALANARYLVSRLP